jgi:SAM-dependent methyltransferase
MNRSKQSENTTETFNQHGLLEWEDLVGSTRFGRYAAAIERNALLRAHHLAGTPTVALEVGCEGGRWAQFLSERSWQLVCTDTNERALAVCQQRVPEATCLLVSQSDTTLPCKDRRIGLLSCIQVFPVIHADWFPDEAARVLSPGGILVGVFLNRAGWRGIVYHAAPLLRVHASGALHWYMHRYSAWRKRLYERGFTMLHEEGYGWSPFRRSSDSPLVPLVVGAERTLGLGRIVRFSPVIVFIARRI